MLIGGKVAKKIVEERKMIVYPGLSLEKADLALKAYIKNTSSDYLDALKERSGEYGTVWSNENERTIRVESNVYVNVYATPTQFVLKKVKIQDPVILLGEKE